MDFRYINPARLGDYDVGGERKEGMNKQFFFVF
jgi:hypothetical protein